MPKSDLPGASAAYQRVIALQPDHPEAHCNLGDALRQQGEFAKALQELRRGHELGSRDPGWRYPSAPWVRQCERLLELDRRLPDFLAGKATPADAAERIELAQFCTLKQRNRAALRYYQEAFAAQPGLLASAAVAVGANAAMLGLRAIQRRRVTAPSPVSSAA